MVKPMVGSRKASFAIPRCLDSQGVLKVSFWEGSYGPSGFGVMMDQPDSGVYDSPRVEGRRYL